MVTENARVAWGSENAKVRLSASAAWLTQERREGRWRVGFARMLAQVATLGDEPAVARIAADTLGKAPDEAFLAGIITNVQSRRMLIRRDAPTVDEARAAFPQHPGSSLLDRERDPHLVLVRQGRLVEARGHATTSLLREEYASACAVVGAIEEALAFIATPCFPKDRRVGPLLVACIESWRLGDLDRTDALLRRIEPRNAQLDVWLAAGFLGRVPWGGYPFPDF